VNLTPEMVAGAAGTIFTGNPAVGLASATAAGAATRGYERLLAGGQKRLDRSLIDRLMLQGQARDDLIQELLAMQAARQPQIPAGQLLRSILGAQGASVPARVE
jgi:hypothetical protein